MEVLDQDEHAGAGVGSADADVVQASGDAQGDYAGLVDAVAADPVVGVGAVWWVGFGADGVGGCQGWPDGAVSGVGETGAGRYRSGD
ncbi:MAG TPA: hypothetical protein VKI00_23110 [Mycobacterium sp.]|uniref:hypothetical protein n=1 Tax=Mycobacterium sp. TaxID=1785 RepID=UPI002B703FBA|nr:hypothetical protein [Mycobacterium sp.]HME78427.1 hypothetical protein [Mycobacterium sp.]